MDENGSMRIERRDREGSRLPVGAVIGAALVVGAASSAVWLRLGLPRPVCLLREWTGIPCPTCGTTRLAESLLSGEVLEAFTWNPAWATFEEDQFGSIRVGKFADLTVMDQNLLEIDTADILKTEVLITIVGGREVYRNPEWR